MKPEHRLPSALREFPLHARHVPAPDKKSPEWAAFADEVHADGEIIEPIIITPNNQVMDGWRRREAACDWQLESVPVIIRPEAEAALFIVRPLVARRTMTRGAAVYIALGLLPAYAQAANRRMSDNAIASAKGTQGRKTNEERLDPQEVSSTRQQPGSLRYLAKIWGCGKDTILQAINVRAHLHDPKVFAAWLKKIDARTQSDTEELMEATRAEFEPLLLTGIKSLWDVLQAIAGRLSGKRSDPQAEQLDLFTGAFPRLKGHWDKLDEDGRAALARTLPKVMADLPDEVLDILEDSITKARAKR